MAVWVRCCILVTSLSSLALGACATQPGGGGPTSSAGTPIYSPPVRLGGKGSVIFLPNTNHVLSANAREEVAVVGALHRFLDPKGDFGCLNPLLDEGDVDASLREAAADELRKEGKTRPTAADVREWLIADQRGSWRSVDEGNAPLSSSVELAVAEAYADAAMAAPRKRQAIVLTGRDLPDLTLKSDCGARLSRPTIYRGWAFVSRSSATAGHLYALRRDANGWSVVGHRFTYII